MSCFDLSGTSVTFDECRACTSLLRSLHLPPGVVTALGKNFVTEDSLASALPLLNLSLLSFSP